MLSLGVTGAVELRYVAGVLRKAGLKDLERERRKAQRDAVKPLQREIRAEAAATLPGGYAPLMARAVRVTVQFGRPGSDVLTGRVYARGRKELRDVRAVNNGVLRHPVFGNRSRWVPQPVRPGFVTRAVDRTWDRVYRASDDAHRRYLLLIARR